MKTAIIGLGNIGSRLAKNLTAGGQNIIVSERNLPKADGAGSRTRRQSPDDVDRRRGGEG